ncbi:MAG: response regulator transcription factor [Rhizobiaceae bacterium]
MAGRPVIALICMPDQAGLDDYLERRGYDVHAAGEEWAADSLLARHAADVAVIGDGLPAGASLDFLRRHAGQEGPSFVVATGRGELIDRVLALELGAADVVAADVGHRELVARIAGLLARRGRGARDLLVLENSTVDLKAALVMHRSGGEEQLSAGQVALLRLFAASPRKVLSRDDIMAAAPAESADAFDRSIDSRIVRLRRKLDTESIVTIRGTGYRFDPPAAR